MNAKWNQPFIIPIFIPHKGCPHQCAFCNQVAITGSTARLPDRTAITEEISRFLSYKRKERFPVQIAFYGGNFLGLPPEDIRPLLESAARFVESGAVNTIRFSTRPDTIDPDHLDIIRPFPVSTIEIGAQSMDDRVLEMANRGHTAKDTLHASALLKEYGYETGIQMMIGLPGDSERISLETGQKIAALKPDFVRIYPTLVIDKSPLAESYRRGDYQPLSLEESVSWTKTLYRHFQASEIRVIRMGLQADEELEKETTVLAGPYHPAFGQLVHAALYLDRVMEFLKTRPAIKKTDSIDIYVHPRQISTMRGQHNGNVAALTHRFGFSRIRILPDRSLREDGIRVQAQEMSADFC